MNIFQKWHKLVYCLTKSYIHCLNTTLTDCIRDSREQRARGKYQISQRQKEKSKPENQNQTHRSEVGSGEENRSGRPAKSVTGSSGKKRVSGLENLPQDKRRQSERENSVTVAAYIVSGTGVGNELD